MRLSLRLLAVSVATALIAAVYKAGGGAPTISY
jgi:hypothetical protein